jgi:uncharacterized protein
MLLKTEKPCLSQMYLSRYLKIYPYTEEPGYLLFFSTKRGSKVLVHESTLKSIEEGKVAGSDEETLVSLGFLVPDRDKEKKEMRHLIDAANREAAKFSAIVVMNLDCNLACKYCYEGDMKGRHYMSTKTVDLLIDFIMRNAITEGKHVNIDFYGGEPLLSYNLISNISRTLKSSVEKKGLEYTFSLITNGTLLTGERTEELSSLGLRSAKITIDGPRENHNSSRPFKSGKGSFDIIVTNIKEASPFTEIQLGGIYTRENYHTFPAFLDYLIEEGLDQGKISIVKFDPEVNPKRRTRLTDFRDRSELINEPWIAEASLYLREEILKRGFHTSSIRPSPCMIEIENDIVVHYDGSLYKCPGFIGQEGFEVGDLKRGIRDYSESHNLDLWKREECLDCEYLPLCFGGCRYMKWLRDGAIDGTDCKKQYYDATLETFIKQEIQYGIKTGDD